MPRKSDQPLFRIECFVEADRLGEVLWLLAGKVLSLTQHPIINARKKNSEVIAKTRGDLVEIFSAWLQEKKLTEFTPAIAREFCTSHGRSETSYGALLTRAAEAGVVKNVGTSPKAARWKVLAPKLKMVKSNG
jgi:hypothetical protein